MKLSFTEKKLTICVLPGVRLVRAKFRLCSKELIRLDFPVFDRPINAYSGSSMSGSCSAFAALVIYLASNGLFPVLNLRDDMSRKIQVLEDELINKIAAGEVVERPASVLKELVENAIDAGARRIDVTLEEGGRRLIMVRDDGCGMSRDDAILSCKRHATSKITQSDDLFNVSTMGFRGEALASISSVSQLVINTRESGAEQGVRLEIKDGEVIDTAWAGPEGTTISVSHLFYNMPARHAFLKSAATEYGHCLEFLQELALARPDLSFSLHHNNRLILDVRSKESGASGDSPEPFWGEAVIRHRFCELFEKEKQLGESLLYLQTRDKFGICEALISPPGFERGSGKMIHTFVNRRWVKDKVLRYAVLRGYHSHLLKGKFPIAYLHVSMDPALVDVNVHPAKAELRFQYPAELQGLIAMAIRDKLRDGNWTQEVTESIAEPQVDTVSKEASSSRAGAFSEPSGDGDQAGSRTNPSIPDSSYHGSQAKLRRGESYSERTNSNSLSASLASSPVKQRERSFDSLPSGSSTGFSSSDSDFSIELPIFESSFSEQSVAFSSQYQQKNPPIPWKDLTFIGSFASCYLMFEGVSRLLVVDQHAFHERILYEKLKNNRALLSESQRLLVPELIELSADQFERLNQHQEDFQGLGFEFKILGNQNVELLAVPSLLAKANTEKLVIDLIASHLYGMHDETNSHLAHNILATLACHSAIRAGEKLDVDDVNDLLTEAHGVDFYLNCPHGRRVFKWWKRSEVEHWFDR